MEKYPYKVLIGPIRLAAMNKKVGERIMVTSINYQDIDLEVEIIGELPGGRYGQSAVMNNRTSTKPCDVQQGKPRTSSTRCGQDAGPGVAARAGHADVHKVAEQIT